MGVTYNDEAEAETDGKQSALNHGLPGVYLGNTDHHLA